MKDDESGLFGCRPVLCVDNVARSISYYVDALGFHVGLTWSVKEQRFLHPGEKTEPTFAIIGRGTIQFMLSQQSQGAAGMWIHLDIHSTDQLDALHDEWRHNGARITEPPSLRPWGMYEMRVEDLDRHTLRVSAPPRSHALA